MPCQRRCGDAMSKRIAQVISDPVREMQAYSVASVAPGMLKMDAMEMPQDLPEPLRAGWAKMIAGMALNRYPAAHNPALEAAIRSRFAIDPGHDVLFGNGSDELIQIIILAAARPGAVILSPAPSFVMYDLCARFSGLRYVGVDLQADFSLDMPAMLAAIKREQPAVIFLASPNNPTGQVYSKEQVQTLIDAAPGLVVIDEAYLAFSEHSLKALAERNDHVLIIRTLSKTGFAGLRFGYLFGAPDWVRELNKVRPPYNVNVLTQASIEYVIAHYDQIEVFTQTIVEERARMAGILGLWSDCQLIPSQANFLVLRVPDGPRWFAQLKEAGVLVKNLHSAHRLTENCLRLNVSNQQDNDRLIAALEQCR